MATTSERAKTAELIRGDDRQRYSGREVAETYDAGVVDGKTKAKAAAKKTPAKKPAKKRPPAKATAKKATRRGRTVGRQAVAAGTGRTGSVVGMLSLSLGLVLLFNFLRAADELAGFLGLLQRAIGWLASPTAVIPFKGESS